MKPNTGRIKLAAVQVGLTMAVKENTARWDVEPDLCEILKENLKAVYAWLDWLEKQLNYPDKSQRFKSRYPSSRQKGRMNKAFTAVIF